MVLDGRRTLSGSTSLEPPVNELIEGMNEGTEDKAGLSVRLTPFLDDPNETNDTAGEFS